MAVALSHAAGRSGSSLHSLGYLQFYHHCGGIMVLVQSGTLENVALLGLYSALRLV